MKNEITVDIESTKEEGKYDTWITSANCSGEHYPSITAKEIGENVADLIDTLEEGSSGKSFLKNSLLGEAQRGEFIGQIIDIFEDFLDKRKISLSNDEKEEAVYDGADLTSVANIYGTDYGDLQTELESMMRNWHIL